MSPLPNIYFDYFLTFAKKHFNITTSPSASNRRMRYAE